MISQKILNQSWLRCWKNLSSLNQLESLKEKLIIAYSEPHRKYHTISHLNDCLTLLNHNYSSAAKPTEIELALWFHDAIYDVHAVNNEEMSADFASKELIKVGLPKKRIELIVELILSTKHSAAPKYIDHMLISDIDLAILGAPRSSFVKYEAKIREEYEWVSESIFQENRI
ncbi:MAG: N-methyl-D-aspartate receptor NMDAR2C subunit, partial [Bacteroidetes bacterium]|nr:N-methyl-D-aspartate receptor NMDAR2C subunit [Bacteroidota bacterium]